MTEAPLTYPLRDEPVPIVHLPERDYNDDAARRMWQQDGYAVVAEIPGHLVYVKCGPCSAPLPDEPAREQAGLLADLAYLAEHGALAGVAEIARERRRQIEALGYDLNHDDAHDGGLVHLIVQQAGRAQLGVAELSEGPEFVEEKMRQAGALAAAEIDRLGRMLAGAELPRRVPGAALEDPDGG